MLPDRMQSIVTTGDGSFELKAMPLPVRGPNELLVKVVAVAQNPTDWKTALLHKEPGNILGSDFSGFVVQVASEGTVGVNNLGQRVAGTVHGGIAPNGAFAEYLAVRADLVISLPEHVSFEDGAQLGVAGLTACRCLYQVLHLPSPLECSAGSGTPMDVLVWSGTSATGQYVIQLAKLAGLRVIATASPKNFDFVKALGADEVFDYADSRTPKKIVQVTGGALRHAVDCISEGMTPSQVSASLGKQGGTIATLLPYESKRAGVRTEFVLLYSIFGKAIEFPFPFPAKPEHHQNGVLYCKLLAELISKGKLKPCPLKVIPLGLAGIATGFEYMKQGKVHAEKITYRIADTPIIAAMREASANSRLEKNPGH